MRALWVFRELDSYSPIKNYLWNNWETWLLWNTKAETNWIKESSGGGGETREESVYRQATEMLEKTPPDFIKHEVAARLEKYGKYDPMNIFLRQEIDRLQRVIGKVK